ncbi:MAG: autotransporter outer membrane beta-barrel domain-containing protein [Campylobacteraceae bacterium]|jgi:outer membrane autotransporter protein|nr:autotransporter outer membrane beta-barrel domain-containing protein [Campylobacteraceae bacterium]
MSNLSLKYIKAILAIFTVFAANTTLSADIITANNVNFAEKIRAAKMSDTVMLDDSYFITAYNIDNIRYISIAGGGSTIDGYQTGRIFATEGNFGGLDNIALQNGYAGSGSGGGLHAAWDINGNINNSIFLNNYASWSGGAIYVYNDFNGNITNSVFTYNNANNYGGAIAVGNLLSASIINSEFTYNTASDNSFGGGAILSGIFNASIENSYFANNRANNGGAVYAESAAGGMIKDTNFINNSASGRGGAIYVHNNANLTLYSTDYMLFSGNTDNSGANAIYFNGEGGGSLLNIITDENAVMEFNDGIADGAGTLSVNKEGNGTLIYNTLMSYKGDTKIHEGMLMLSRYGGVSGTLEIGDKAALLIDKYQSFTLTNTTINKGTLDINLNNHYNLFAFEDAQKQANFNGSLILSNAAYNMQKEGNYSLTLNGAVAKMSDTQSALKNLTFNGGTLDAGAFNLSLSSELLLSTGELNITNGGGTIIINSDISGENIYLAADTNLYNITQNIYSPFYQLIHARDGVNTVNAELEIINISDQNLAETDIVQNTNIVGKALLGTAAKTEDDGVYMGFRLEGVNSLTSVVMDSSDISNNVFDVFLTGNGNFIFTGSNQTFIGNDYSNYTGYTVLKNQAKITAVSSNAFGYTSKLFLERDTAFDMNGYYQIVGDIENEGVISLHGGYIESNGFALNNGIINLGDYGTASFGKGASVGSDSLRGYGYLYFNDNFNISGKNNNLGGYTYIYGGTLRLNHADSLGENNYIQLSSSSAKIAFDISGDERLENEIYGYSGSLIKDGGGDLTLGRYVRVNSAEIVQGGLILNTNNFYGDIAVLDGANLIFDNNADSAFYNRLSGNGNITQKGEHALAIYSNSAGFNGNYNISGGSLQIGSSGALGGNIGINSADFVTYGSITGNLLLENSTWTLHNNINMKTLLASNSNIYLGGQNSDFYTTPAVVLNIDNLHGSGDIYQRLNIEKNGGVFANSGDILKITNSSHGDYTLHFDDKSTGGFSYQKDTALLVVEQDNPLGSYHANFTGEIDIGAFTYALWQSNSSSNKNIYLKASACATPACASLAFPNINYAVNYVNIDTLSQRMGKIDFNRNDKDNVWINTYTGQLDYSDYAFMINDIGYNGVNIGVDRSYDDYLLGLTLGYSKTDINYMEGGASAKSYSAGIYALLKNEDKFYLNALIKYQTSKNSFNTATVNGFTVDGDGNTHDVVFSIEAGKKYAVYNTSLYIEPQIQSIFARYSDMVIDSSNGLRTNIDKFESIRTRLSAVLGYEIGENVNIYLKAGYIKEFESEAVYSFNHGQKQAYKIDDNIFDSAAGITLDTNGHNLYFESTYQKSNMFNNKKAALGYKYKF